MTAHAADELVVRTDGPVATLAFNRPAARNALTPAMLQGMAKALREWSARTDLRVVVIRGAGELPFSAGYDMAELPAGPLSAAHGRAIHAPVRAVADAMLACPHPVLGVVRKFVFGAALDLFAHCDLRVCAEGSTFCMPPNRYSFLYPTDGLRRLTQVGGHAAVADLLLTAQPMPAERALAHGLVQRVLPQAGFEEELTSLLTAVAANAPLSMRGTKQALQALTRDDPVDEQAMYQAIADCLNSADAREAQLAFREKRPPVFVGR